MDSLLYILVIAGIGVSKASDQACIDIGGICQDDSIACSGSYYTGKCSGSVSRRCCVSASNGNQPCIYTGETCLDDRVMCSVSYHSRKCSGSVKRRYVGSDCDQPCLDMGGTCQDDSITCSGSYYTGKCSGNVNRRCCVSSTGGDQECLNMGGTCQDDSKGCYGSYYSGKCTGITTRRCCTKTAVERDTGDCRDVVVISRDSWGARRAKSSSHLTTPVQDFFIHHTAGHQCTTFLTCVAQLKSIQNYHMDTRNWADIGYSFLVGEDGKIYEGRGWDRTGSHTYGYNSKSLAASFMGKFDTRKPNTAALRAAYNLIECGVAKGKIASSYALFGHRDVSTSTCPGNELYDIIKMWPRFHAHNAK